MDRAGQDRRTGATAAGPATASSLDAHESFIVGLIEAQKDITLNEMVERLDAGPAVKISRSALSAWLRGRGWT